MRSRDLSPEAVKHTAVDAYVDTPIYKSVLESSNEIELGIGGFEHVEQESRESLTLELSSELSDVRSEVIDHHESNSYLTSSVRYGEISHDDLQRMSLSNSAPLPTRKLRDRHLSPVSSFAYGVMMIYEISVFDVVPGLPTFPEDEPILPCCPCIPMPSFIRTASEPKPSTSRNLKVSASIDSPSNLPVQFTDCKDGSLSPSWKSYTTPPNRIRPTEFLFRWELAACDITNGLLHVEVHDETTGDVIAEAAFEMSKIFESTFGSVSIPHYKQMSFPEEFSSRFVDSVRPKKMSSHSLGSSNSPVTNSLNYSGNSSPAPSVVATAGRVRLRIAVASPDFVEDLLRGPDEQVMVVGLNLIMRLVQNTDPQQAFQKISVPDQQEKEVKEEEDELLTPLRAILSPKKLQFIFSTLEILQKDPVLSAQPTALAVARRRLASLISNIFTTGIGKFGPLFANALTPFGEELVRFVDLSMFGEDLCLAFIDIIQSIPIMARIEALIFDNGSLVKTLLKLASLDRMEDIQVKALVNLNVLAMYLEELGHWSNLFLDMCADLKEYLEEQLESWHPQIAEESLILYTTLAENRKLKISEDALESLKRILNENPNGVQAELVNKLLFTTEYRLVKLPLTIETSSCASRIIYVLPNLCSSDSPQMRTPHGVVERVRIICKFADRVSLTHLLAEAPCLSSLHRVNTIWMKPLLEKPAEDINFPESECIVMDFTDEVFLEIALDSVVEAEYLYVMLNPTGSESSSHIEVEYIGAIGYIEKLDANWRASDMFGFDVNLPSRKSHSDLGDIKISSWVGYNPPKPRVLPGTVPDGELPS